MLILIFPFLLAATEPFEQGPIKGIKWTTTGEPGPGERIIVAAQSPHDPTLFIAGGMSGGIWRSQDSCNSWRPSLTPIPFAIQSILFHPKDPGRVLAGTINGVFSSTDGGVTWQEHRKGFPPLVPNLFTAPVSVLTLIPGEKQDVLAGFGTLGSNFFVRNSGQLYKSRDWGESWELIDMGYGKINNIAFSISNPKRAVMANSIGVFFSMNRGQTWARSLKGLPFRGARDVFTIQTPFPAFIATMDNKDRFLSLDYGLNWKACPSKAGKPGSTTPFADPSLRTTILDKVNRPNKGNGLSLLKSKKISFSFFNQNTFALVEQKGIWITENKGKSYRKSYQGLPADFFPKAVIFSRIRKNHLFCWPDNPTKDCPVFASSNKGDNWRKIFQVPAKNLFDLLTSDRNPYEFLALVKGKILRTINSGKSWQKVLFLPHCLEGGYFTSDTGGYFTPDTESARKIFLTWGGAEGGIWESGDHGRTWQRMFPALPHTHGHVGITLRGEILACADNAVYRWDRKEWTILKKSSLNAVDIAITNGRIVVAIFADLKTYPQNSPGEVWYSSNYGRKWFSLRKGISGPPPCVIASNLFTEGLLILGTRGGGFFKLTWPAQQDSGNGGSLNLHDPADNIPVRGATPK